MRARQALGLCLGRLGDPRIFDLRDPRAYVEVPAGTYPYGEEGETVEIAAPFRIGRYPVTNGQYRAFIEDGGYPTGNGGRMPAGLAAGGRGRRARQWRDRRWNAPNQPVVGVSFFEAEACCAWAGGRLPPEQEWEAAARGTEGYEYPWGDDWEDGICNSREAGLGITSPVGLFPRSRQALLGIEDLAGNVGEWCASFFYDPRVRKKSPPSHAVRRVLGASIGIWRDASAATGWARKVGATLVKDRVLRSSPLNR